MSLCQRLIAQHPQDWRARLALSRHVSAAGHHGAALDLLFDALPHHPHALIIHQEVWRVLGALEFNAVLVGRYTDLTRGAVFYLDPHICTTCRYRSTELLWQCPQCHDWDTFIEERITRRGRPSGEAGLGAPPSDRVALTGGIATGKSYVRARFEDLGVPTIDADALARDAMAPEHPAWRPWWPGSAPACWTSIVRLNRGRLPPSSSPTMAPGAIWKPSSIRSSAARSTTGIGRSIQPRRWPSPRSPAV